MSVLLQRFRGCARVRNLGGACYRVSFPLLRKPTSAIKAELGIQKPNLNIMNEKKKTTLIVKHPKYTIQTRPVRKGVSEFIFKRHMGTYNSNSLFTYDANYDGNNTDLKNFREGTKLVNHKYAPMISVPGIAVSIGSNFSPANLTFSQVAESAYDDELNHNYKDPNKTEKENVDLVSNIINILDPLEEDHKDLDDPYNVIRSH